MKKLTFVAGMAIAAVALVSCDGGAPKASLKSDIDTLTYAIGVANSPYMKQMIQDTAYTAEFIKGIKDGANAGDDKKKAAYFAGFQLGQEIGSRWKKGLNEQIYGADTTKTISMRNLLAGLIGGINGEATMTPEEAGETAQRLMDQIQKTQQEKAKKEGEAFLAENAKKEGVKVTESGLQYKVLKAGNGAIPNDSSIVRVKYRGTLVDGTEFDSSSKYGDEPATFRANQVIKGWTEALTMMPVGSKWELYIPYQLAYGEQGSRGIRPYSALIFEVELVEIKDAE